MLFEPFNRSNAITRSVSAEISQTRSKCPPARTTLTSTCSDPPRRGLAQGNRWLHQISRIGLIAFPPIFGRVRAVSPFGAPPFSFGASQQSRGRDLAHRVGGGRGKRNGGRWSRASSPGWSPPATAPAGAPKRSLLLPLLRADTNRVWSAHDTACAPLQPNRFSPWDQQR